MSWLTDMRLALMLTKARHACAAYGHLPGVLMMYKQDIVRICPNCGKEV